MKVGTLSRAAFCAAIALLAFAHLADAECVTPPPEPTASVGAPTTADQRNQSAIGEIRTDRGRRVIAPVSVNGQGPFRFIVDTGANRSVLSRELANRLGLISQTTGQVNSIGGVSTAPMVEVSSVSYHGLALPSSPLPVIEGAMFDGEQGLLGVDGMEGRRLRMDFLHGCVEITLSRASPRLHGWTSVRGQLRFGELIVMLGDIHGVRTNIIIDTGSDASLANIALRDALAARLGRNTAHVEAAHAYTAGMPLILNNAIAVPHLQMGDLSVSNILAYVGDFHIFELWGLKDEPTLLLGMDVMGALHGLAIDYGRSMVQFQMNDDHKVGIGLLTEATRLRD